MIVLPALLNGGFNFGSVSSLKRKLPSVSLGCNVPWASGSLVGLFTAACSDCWFGIAVLTMGVVDCRKEDVEGGLVCVWCGAVEVANRGDDLGREVVDSGPVGFVWSGAEVVTNGGNDSQLDAEDGRLTVWFG